jgi:hypothetical protein
MIARPSSPENRPAGPQDPASEDVRLLARMAALGERMAMIVVAQAEARQQADADAPGLTPTFDAVEMSTSLERVGRYVRRNLALKRRFQAEDETGLKVRVAERSQRVLHRRSYIELALVRAIRADGRSDDAHEALFNDLNDRLEILTDDDVEARPVGAWVQDICTQLRLPFDLMRFADESWAIDEIVERPAGSPYADPHWNRPPRAPGALQGCTSHAAGRVDSS